MKNASGRKPSASMIVALAALIMSGTGTAIAAKALMNGDKLIAKQSLSGNRLRNHTLTGRQIDLQRLGEVPFAGQADRALTADHASSADTAASGTTAANANDAAHLGGQPASAFALAGARGVAIAGAHVSPSGTVTGTAYGWFNTLGGSPTITHTFATGVYTIDFPGIGNVLHYVFQASLDIHGEITAGSASGGTHVAVTTYDDTGVAADNGFNITIYAASNSG